MSLSIKFTKKTVVKLTNGAAATSNDDDEFNEEEERQKKFNKIRKITTLDEFGFAVVDDNDQPEAQIVIPALPNTLKFKPNAQSLDDLAKNALIEDVLRLNNGTYVSETTNTSLDLILVNGDVSENRRLDLTELPDMSEEADYMAVPVESYGKALLRGLGWSEGQPIGKNVKKTVVPIVTAPRPKGLGLGAQITAPGAKKTEEKNGESKEKEELILKIGAFFKTKKDEYGEIIGLDEDNARVLAKMALSKSTTSLSQHGVHLVTKKEYEKYSKCINKQKYDKYKEEDEKKMLEKQRKSTSENKKTLKNDRNSSPDVEILTKNEWNSSKNERNSSKNDRKRISDNEPSWLYPDLKVRIIDKKYEKGKFYKEKVVVVDVVSKETCNCLTESRKILENLHENQLETVVPRHENGSVMIVSGRQRGKFGVLIERDTKKCLAAVKLTDGLLVEVGFDDICEYIGDVGD